METKKIKVDLEEVKVVSIMIDLGSLERYMDRFLALKNHERHTREILEVRGFDGSNSVSVTLMIDENEDEAKEVEHCMEYVGQFGNIVGNPDVDTAFIFDKDANGIDGQLDWKELYVIS